MGAIVLLRSARSSENCTASRRVKDLLMVKGAHSRAPAGEAGGLLARTPLATREGVLSMAQASAPPGRKASARSTTPSALVAPPAHPRRIPIVSSPSLASLLLPPSRTG